MSIPMTDLKTQYQRYRDEFNRATQSVMEQSAFILGKGVEQFEKNFAEFCGAAHCVGVANGTDAIGMAFTALGIKPGDEIITTPFTFIATIEGIIECGAVPRLADIDPRTYCIDPEKINSMVTSKTKAIIPVHLYGRLCDMKSIMAIAKKHNLKVVEDAAQAHGAAENGKTAGSFADAATFSFYPGKNLGAFGDGGAITTQSKDTAERLKLIRNHGRTAKYMHEVLGRNSRLDALQAAILMVKLPHLNEWNRTRIARAKNYNQEIGKIASKVGVEIVCPELPKDKEHIFHLYTIRTPKRDALAEHLKTSGIECAVHYPIALHEQMALRHLGIKKGSLPVAEKVAQEVISLPMCPDLTPENQHKVVEAIAKFYSK